MYPNRQTHHSIYCKPYCRGCFIHACGGVSRGSRPLQGAPGLCRASKGLQGPPGAFGGSRDLEEPPKHQKTSFERKMHLPRTAKASNLGRGSNFMRDGRAGLGHPPWQGAGVSAKRGFFFFTGSERLRLDASANSCFGIGRQDSLLHIFHYTCPESLAYVHSFSKEHTRNPTRNYQALDAPTLRQYTHNPNAKTRIR